jgi:tRNA(Arg) A34 adenosine deaminase TadA
MTDHQYFIREAINCAKEAEAQGGCAIGAVIAKDGKVVSRGLSLPFQRRDPSSHGEIDCIRNYAKEHGMDFSGCTLYGTLEPCSMCLGAALWSGIERVVFGAYASDVPKNSYEYENYSSVELAKKSRKAALPSNAPIQVTGGVARDECIELLQDYTEWQR